MGANPTTFPTWIRFSNLHTRATVLSLRVEKFSKFAVRRRLSVGANMTFLLTEFGKPFTASGFGNKSFGSQKPAHSI